MSKGRVWFGFSLWFGCALYLTGLEDNHLKLIEKTSLLSSGYESTFKCRGLGFNPGLRMVLVAKSGLSLVTTWTVARQLLCLWDSPGKNTGVGCHFFLQAVYS